MTRLRAPLVSGLRASAVSAGRRVSVVLAGCGLVLSALAACGGGGDSAPAASAPAGPDLSQQGDIEYWAGKDNTGDVKRMLKAFNDQHPNGKVTFRELPALADQQRQQMIRGMVTQLETRLAEQGGTAEEWARLITALARLGDAAHAREIWTEAQGRFAGRPEALAAIARAAAEAGLAGKAAP